jgi:hypothetical protein
MRWFLLGQAGHEECNASFQPPPLQRYSFGFPLRRYNGTAGGVPSKGMNES